jgi:hypothetical protein
MTCRRCGALLARRPGSGRQREYCWPCADYSGRYYWRNRESVLEKNRQRAARQRTYRSPPPCAICGRPTPSARNRYCGPDCARQAGRANYQRRMTPDKREAKRARDREREREQRLGVYVPPPPGKAAPPVTGVRHRLTRASWAPLVASGRVACARCGRLIAAGAKWDLGHDDHDPNRYVGPEHVACNRATSSRGRRRQRATSRAW